jgi:hypothetical protein
MVARQDRPFAAPDPARGGVGRIGEEQGRAPRRIQLIHGWNHREHVSLTDAEWALVAALIRPAKHGGRPRKANVREVLNAMFYVLSTGCPRQALARAAARITLANLAYNMRRLARIEGRAVPA